MNIHNECKPVEDDVRRKWATIGILIGIMSWAQASAQTPFKQSIADSLDALHAAASKADSQRYFNLFSEDAIFFGTDATERWNLAEFKNYVTPFFSKGQGWTYGATERHIFFSDDKKTAWFDERLHNKFYGECRGTGVFSLIAGQWKIRQYNLAMPIPNVITRDVVKMIKENEAKK